MPSDCALESRSLAKPPSSPFELTKPLCKELVSQLETYRLLIFYGESGLGVQDVQDCFLRVLVMNKMRVLGFSAKKSISAVKASDALVRFARKIIKEEDPSGSVVVISELPASDEMETRRQVKAIKRVLESGFSVVLSLEPEASQVLESFDVYGRVDTGLVRDYVERIDSAVSCGTGCAKLSRGIPQLYLALLNSAYTVDGNPPVAYFELLADAVGKSVGSALTDEETRFRLYLYLLGAGSVDDVEDEIGFKALELFQEVEGQSPLFGVSLREGSFLTLPEQAGMPLDYLFDVLRIPLRDAQEVIYRAACSLFERNTKRSVDIATRLKGAFLGRYVLNYGEELLDMGKFELVRRGLASVEPDEEVDENLRMALEAALSALTERCFSASLYQALTTEFIENFSAGNARARTALMFVDARMRFCGETRDGYEEGLGVDSTQARLRLHANVFRHIVRGELKEAIKLFVGKSAAGQEPTISSALLALDSELIRLMNCDSSANGGLWFDKSKAFLEHLGQSALLDYLSVVVGMRELFSDMGQSDEGSYNAGRRLSEDGVIRAFMLLEETVEHMRLGVWTHAHIEANYAYGLLAATDGAQLRDMARLLSCVARDTLGEHVDIEPDTYAEGMRQIAMIVARALVAGEDETLSSSGPRSLPRENAWFILLLSNGLGSFSVQFEDELFPEWRRALASARKTVCPTFGMREMAPIVLLEPTAGEASKKAGKVAVGQAVDRLRINLLGDFSVYVGSRMVDGARLEARSSKAMLEFLALHKRYTASQARLIEQLWPGVSYSAALERLYQTKSHIRKALRSAGFTADPFITAKMNGTVGLDAALVSCDVDELLAKARATINEKDDARTVELALETESAYAGDLWVPSSDTTGYVTHMASTVKTAYTDALLSGAESALRTGRLRVASRLARGALLADPMREDAEMVLLRALEQSGRRKEASESYGLFCRNLAELAGRPVSKRLRALAAELLLSCDMSA